VNLLLLLRAVVLSLVLTITVSSVAQLALSSQTLAFNGAAPMMQSTRSAGVSMMDIDGLKAQAKSLNPVVGFFDPLNLSGGEFWGDSNAATIGFLREAEIKHGRVAMAGFVGYIVHANDIRFPWPQGYEVPTGQSPQALWDSIPEIAKWQIILTIAFFEFWRTHATAQLTRAHRTDSTCQVAASGASGQWRLESMPEGLRPEAFFRASLCSHRVFLFFP